MRYMVSLAVAAFLAAGLVAPPRAAAQGAAVTLPVIPNDALSRESIPEPCALYGPETPKRYLIIWNDTPGTDGEFIVVIHPTQVFLRSAHDNPNPDRLYWFSAISPAQYRALSAFLDRYRGAVFRVGDPWEWPGYRVLHLKDARKSPWYTGKEEDARQKRVRETIAGNVGRIFRELNRALPGEGMRLHAPAADALARTVVIADDRTKK